MTNLVTIETVTKCNLINNKRAENKTALVCVYKKNLSLFALKK